MDNRVDILFRTGRFNLSKVETHFINDCCFGQDLIVWLRDKLIAAGFVADEPYQEDWGWEVEFRRDSRKYFVGASGISNEDPAHPDLGEWRVFVQPYVSIKDRFLKRTIDNLLLTEIERLLAVEHDFKNVRRDGGKKRD